jgi:tetratricopeptide (TPR) repeat protein
MQGLETTDIAAYESYLKGLEQQAINSYGSLTLAESHFKQAFAHDRDFVDARLALVGTYFMMLDSGLIKKEDVEDKVEPLIEYMRRHNPGNLQARALELVSKLMTTKVLLTRHQYEPIVAELRGILQERPTETFVRTWLAEWLNYFKEYDQAQELLLTGLLVDPLDAALYRMLGYSYMAQKRNDEALTALRKAQQLRPKNPLVYSGLAKLEMENNNLLGTLEWYRLATEVDPQDHELAAEIARILYQLKLVEEGDQWYARVTVLAPNSPLAMRVQLQGYIARDETDKILGLASTMIRDKIENRRDAFAWAVFTYGQVMLDMGKSREAYDFLVSIRPEITDYEKVPKNINGLLMQMSSIFLMTGFASTEVRLDAWLKLSDNMDKAGYPWREPNQLSFIYDKLFTGDTDTAISAFLEQQLSRPLATDLTRYIPISKPMLAELYADPGVTRRMAELGEEYAQLRKQVREMLLQPEWNQ